MKPSFKQFLCEQEEKASREQIISYVKEYCQPFLTQATRLHSLFRGITIGSDSEPYYILSPRSDRTPKDTPMEVHKIADEWFLENFGHRFRSHAVFGAADLLAANEYGEPYYLFPIGEFSFCWSPVYNDMYVQLEKKLHLIDGEDSENVNKIVIKFLENGHYQNTDLADACRVGHEIMINCDKYIIVNRRSFDWREFF